MPCFGTRSPLGSKLVTPPIPIGTEEKRHRYFRSPIDPVFPTTVSILTVRETGAISVGRIKERSDAAPAMVKRNGEAILDDAGTALRLVRPTSLLCTGNRNRKGQSSAGAIQGIFEG